MGSSPLARGLPDPAGLVLAARRIIPARAGFTWNEDGTRSTPTDHPRSRGVYSPVTETVQSPDGSSPLARGLRQLGGRQLPRDGIIPARAGFTSSLEGLTMGTTDHPRSRGVYRDPGQDGPWTDRGRCHRGRIIPARAGFTNTPTSRATYARDHPRSRGVYGQVVGGEGGRRGSSPLARGLLWATRKALTILGIIPARAGFTHHHHHRRPRAQDHPRSRGVYRHRDRRVTMPAGSSPLARGLRTLNLLQVQVDGIIPARAGFTRCRRRR